MFYTQTTMLRQLSKLPILPLFIISILPVLFIYGNSKLWSVINILCITFFSTWTYSVIKSLLGKNKYDDSLRLRPFLIQLVLTTIYVIALGIYYALTYPDIEDPKWFILVIIFGQLFLAWNTFYILSFFAKTIVTIQNKQKTRFPDYLGYMVLLLFFPIGIWWVHPKIQTLLTQ